MTQYLGSDIYRMAARSLERLILSKKEKEKERADERKWGF